MPAGYRAFCHTCLWDDGHFTQGWQAQLAADQHVAGNDEHLVEVEEWPYEYGADEEGG
jgi:hypothetical protein